MFKFISLFSGIGGFDLGFERAGMACVAQVEFDESASAVLNYWWPNVPQFKDVRDVGKHNLPAVDLICGGFPCQDVSVAGKREGLAGERSGLWFEFLRIIGEIAPQWVVIENVPGLLSSNGGRDFAVILRGLVECGYRVSWRVLDSQHFGVPQRRRRVFIVASLGDGSCGEILFESESLRGDFAPGRAARQGVTGQSQGGTGITSITGWDYQGRSIYEMDGSGTQNHSVTPGTGYSGETSNPLIGTLSASGAGTARPAGQKNKLDFLVMDTYGISGELNAHKDQIATLDTGSPTGSGQRAMVAQVFNKQRTDQYSPASVGSTLAARDYKDAGDLVAVPLAFQYNAGASVGMGVSADISPTLQVSDSHPPAGQQAAIVRRLTPTECERLQSFPDGWTAVNGQADTVRYRQLGNAVTVNVTEWLGNRIMDVAGFNLLTLAQTS